jgi:hypothetical protein
MRTTTSLHNLTIYVLSATLHGILRLRLGKKGNLINGKRSRVVAKRFPAGELRMDRRT